MKKIKSIVETVPGQQFSCLKYGYIWKDIDESSQEMCGCTNNEKRFPDTTKTSWVYLYKKVVDNIVIVVKVSIELMSFELLSSSITLNKLLPKKYLTLIKNKYTKQKFIL